ncbi:hypothetical protein FNV43_RR00632 [Rhamnella rubrinervis]|uniref:Uncharacterized protein n=1 Tax=Rhamnella rubrinervis TaxID=2594499 RepID=A0A8K0MS51_9ROSA|nr:hypothetical protein FNV43_RR00632 [Rhamnella rubrinervis]
MRFQVSYSWGSVAGLRGLYWLQVDCDFGLQKHVVNCWEFEFDLAQEEAEVAFWRFLELIEGIALSVVVFFVRVRGCRDSINTSHTQAILSFGKIGLYFTDLDIGL